MKKRDNKKPVQVYIDKYLYGEFKGYWKTNIKNMFVLSRWLTSIIERAIRNEMKNQNKE